MSAPIYVNMAELQMYKTKEEGEMVLMRFLYKETKMKNPEAVNRPNPMTFNAGAFIMPKKVAKDFLKKFLGFIAVHDEHWVEGKGGKT